MPQEFRWRSNYGGHTLNLVQRKARSVERRAAYLRWRYGPIRDGGRRHGLNKPLIVSLTSYPSRFKTLPLTIKCLMSQSVRPDEVVLWIAHEDRAQLTRNILSLQEWGLSIRYCGDMRSFKKIIPMIELRPDCYIATADDDIFYPVTWLDELIAEFDGSKAEVLCHRAHKIRLNGSGLPLPYSEWERETPCRDGSRLIFPTGGAGALYPPGIFDPRVIDEATFARLCPTADDVWLYWMVRLKGGTSRCIGRRPVMTWPVRQTEQLSSENLGPTGRNDICIEQMIKHFGFPA